VQITANLPLNERENYSGYPLVFGVRLFSSGGAPESTVTTQQTSCGSLSCRFTVSMPAGSDRFSVTYAYGSQGTATGNLAPLSYQAALTASISSASSSVTANLLGVPAYYELDASGNSPWTGTMPLLLQAVDDSNTCTPQQQINDCALTAFITGTYAAPITLVDTDTSGQTALTLNSGAPATSVTVTKSTDSVALRIAPAANVSQGYVTPSGSFNSSEFGSAYQPAVSLTPWATQDPNGLGFTCTSGSCQTTGPSTVTIQSHIHKLVMLRYRSTSRSSRHTF
jgi:hypothetical protein